MIELVRSWLIGITCAAMIVALAEGVTPSGTVRKIGKLTGGLVLLLAVLQPILKVDSETLSQSMMAYQTELGEYNQTLEKENVTLMKAIIEERSCAYILDKATEFGIVCEVEVTVQAEEYEAKGYPIPVEVKVRGTWTPDQKDMLVRQIEADFSIPEDRQFYFMEESE